MLVVNAVATTYQSSYFAARRRTVGSVGATLLGFVFPNQNSDRRSWTLARCSQSMARQHAYLLVLTGNPTQIRGRIWYEYVGVDDITMILLRSSRE